MDLPRERKGEMPAHLTGLAAYLSLICALVLFAGCGGGGGGAASAPGASNRPAMVSIKVLATDPSNTSGPVTLRTGMIFGNEKDVTMTRPTGSVWEATVLAPEGTILRYAYRLNGDWNRSESYELRPGQFHYREVLVAKNLLLHDAISRWGGSLTTGATGTLSGTVYEEGTWLPVMGATVSAGPYQTMTRWDGTYSIKGVPAGACAVTVHADNGEYQTKMMEITVPANGTTSGNFMLAIASSVTVTFRVTVPVDTPVNAVPRLYGDTYRLGMFPYFEGTAIDPSRAIDMNFVSGRTWSHAVQLGKGSCYQYLYTLGDIRINNDRDALGAGIVRSFCATGAMTLDDTVVSWKVPGQVPVTLTSTSPTVTDTVYVTTDGWGGYEPLRMWPQGAGQWQYVLYTDPASTLNYRYVRNGDPAIGLEVVGADPDPPLFRSINTGATGTSVSDTITAWRHGLRETPLSTVTTSMTGTVVSRTTGSFQTGVEMIDYWRPAWKPLIVPSIQRIKEKNATWVQIPSVWGLVSVDPPIIDRGWNSFTTEDLVGHIRAAKAQGLKVALRPIAFPASTAEEAGFKRTNANEWYDQFFDQVKAMYRYHARIAQQEGVEMLILGNFNWMDDDNAGQATHINQKWNEVIAAVRPPLGVYTGKITTDNYVGRLQYNWYQYLDYLGDKWWWPLASSGTATMGDMYTAAADKLNNYYLPISQSFSNKPFVFSEIAYYSADSSAQQIYGVYAPEIGDFIPETASVASAWQQQADAYEAVLWAFAETPWVQGCYSFGYAYFDFDSKGYSVRGKTAEEVMSQIYLQLNAL